MTCAGVEVSRKEGKEESSVICIEMMVYREQEEMRVLDLVVTPADCDVDDLQVDPAGIISDHSLISCSLPRRHSGRRTAIAVAGGRIDRHSRVKIHQKRHRFHRTNVQI